MNLGRFLEYHYKGNVTIKSDRGILCQGPSSYAYAMVSEFDLDSEIKSMQYKIVKSLKNDVFNTFETLEIKI